MKKILDKIKNFMKSLFVDKIFNKEWLKNNIGIVIIGILVFIFLAAILVYFLGTRSISKLEENKLKEKSRELINYIDDISLNKSKDIDKYIIYTLDYSYNVNSKRELTCDEISDFINDNFSKKIDSEDVKNMGVSPLMLEKNITYDNVKNSYKLNDVKKSADAIAKEKIVYYKLKKIRKSNKKKYTITYVKYVIEDPYKMLDYYIEKNRVAEGKENEDGTTSYDLMDITIFRNYLMGSAKVGDIKKILSEHEEDLDKFAKKDGKLKVTFVYDGDNLLINKIKK